MAAGIGGVLLLALGIWVIVRNKDGKEVAKIKVPDGGSATIQNRNSTASSESALQPTSMSPEGTVTFQGHRYRLVKSEVKDSCTWEEARTKAEEMGGHLVTINSKEERDWIYENVYLKRPNQESAYARIFLGAERVALRLLGNGLLVRTSTCPFGTGKAQTTKEVKRLG